MNFLVLIEFFYPTYDATGTIANKILDSEYFSRFHYFIISKSNCKYKEKTNYKIFGIPVFGACQPNHSIWYKIKFFFYKFYQHAFKSKMIVNGIDFQNTYRRAKKIVKQNMIDRVICFCGDYYNLKVAYKINKNFNIPYYIYATDPLFLNPTRKDDEVRLLKRTRLWFDKAAFLFYPPEYKQNFSKINKNENQYLCLPLPCFFSSEDLSIIEGETCNDTLLYSGAFFPHIRTPDDLVWFSYLISSLMKYQIICLGRLNKYFCDYKFSPAVVFKERVERDELLHLYGKARAYLLFDNVGTNQIPSKAFEYISTGKPILYFTHDIFSNTSKIMSKYKNVLFVNQIKYNSDIRTIVSQFLEKKTKYQPDFPEYELDHIYKKIYDAIFQQEQKKCG